MRTLHSTCNPAQLMNEEVTTRVVDESMDLSWNHGASEVLEPGTQLETSQGGTLMDLVEASRSYPSANMPRSLELVADGSVPCGYLGAFLRLEEPAKKAAERRSSLSESSAAMELEPARERQCAQKQVEQHQSELKPRRFRTKWQRRSYEGATARRDAEQDLRSKYVRPLADVLRNTNTPIGKLLRESAGNIELLGARRHASTLRSRMRVVSRRARIGFSRLMEAADRVPAGSLVRAVCPWCVDVDALGIHFPARGRGRGAQTYRRCSYQKGIDGICAAQQTFTPGAALHSHRTRSIGRSRRLTRRRQGTGE